MQMVRAQTEEAVEGGGGTKHEESPDDRELLRVLGQEWHARVWILERPPRMQGGDYMAIQGEIVGNTVNWCKDL